MAADKFKVKTGSVLITNDDGCRSPFLVPFVKALSKLDAVSETRVVVPDTEQSWVAQSISRFSPLLIQNYEFGSLQGFTASGTPADCASLGIHNLYDDKPEFVCSGINMGVNAGLAYFLSSGTVGGAAEAMLAGVKAAAFSAELPHELYAIWHRGDEESLQSYSEFWQRIAAISAKVAERLIERDAWDYASFYSVNIPWSADLSTPIRTTQLTTAYFGPLFSKLKPDVYQHRHDALILIDKEENYPRKLPFKATFRDEPPLRFTHKRENGLPGDLETLAAGEVSITPISYSLSIGGAKVAALLE